MVAGFLARDALDLVVGRVFSVVGCCCLWVLLCLWQAERAARGASAGDRDRHPKGEDRAAGFVEPVRAMPGPAE